MQSKGLFNENGVEKMATSKKRGYVCFEQAVSEDECKALTLYWEIDFDEMGFKHKVNDLKKQFAPSIGNIASLARSKTSYSCDLPNFQCVDCGNSKSIKIRSNFKEQANQYGYTCSSCLEKRETGVLTKFALVVEKYTSDLYSSSFDYTTLSYLEKVLLFLLLSEYHKKDGEPLYCDAKQFSLTGCRQTDLEYISVFVQKDALLIVDEVSSEVKELKDEFRRIREMKFRFHESSSSYGMRVSYRSEQMDSYASGMYLRFSDYKTASELKTKLYADICKRELTQSDYSDFKFLVERTRTSTILDIAEDYADEFNLSLEHSIKLDNVLRYLAKNYKLPVVSYFLFRRAEYLAAELHKNPAPKYIENKLYAKQIDDYLTICKSKDWEISYTKRLPFELNTSLFESFICSHFFDNCLNWFELTTSEVLEQWSSGDNLDVNLGVTPD